MPPFLLKHSQRTLQTKERRGETRCFLKTVEVYGKGGLEKVVPSACIIHGHHSYCAKAANPAPHLNKKLRLGTKTFIEAVFKEAGE